MSDYDIIIIGTGAGGGTVLSRVAPSGKKILVLERGGFLPREKANWDPVAVFLHDRYHTDETWYDAAGSEVHPGTGYWVGGNTKVYGGALFRFRVRDFERLPHKSGISPEWPIKYRDLEPYYAEAERLYDVHGQCGVDPTEPPRSGPYPHPPIAHEPRIQELHDALEDRGLHPFSVPLGVRLDQASPLDSPCIRCDTCDGHPCLVDAKADADVNCVRPALDHPNVTLLTGAHVMRILTNASGLQAIGVEADVQGETLRFYGHTIIVACGAINSAVLLLRSANDRHPHGLANGSGLVGRNFMKHHNGAILAVSSRPNPTVFQKTLAVNDFYFGEPEFEFPMGHVSLLGKTNGDALAAGAPGFAPGVVLDKMARHSLDFWLTAEDLPVPENRVRVEGERGERIVLEYRDLHTEGYDRLMRRWRALLKSIDADTSFLPNTIYFRSKIPLASVGHQCGTLRFGSDPRTSVLDADCRAHEIRNLFVADASFFPSSAAMNPSLTIMANALRVGDIVLEELA